MKKITALCVLSVILFALPAFGMQLQNQKISDLQFINLIQNGTEQEILDAIKVLSLIHI